MSTNTNQSEEIDLGYLIKSFNSFFRSTVKSLYHVILFFLKHKFVVIGLIIIGVGYGIYKDKNSEPLYLSKGILVPNFESVDYLYDKVNVLNQKISIRDTIYLKDILGEDYKSIRGAEIEPIADIYNVMTKSREQIDVFRIIFQNQDMQDFVEDMTTSKYYKYHRISFKVLGESSSERVILKILDHWNSNEHYTSYSAYFRENNELQIKEFRKLLTQMDSILASIGSISSSSTSGLMINENNNLHLFVEKKKDVIKDLLAAEIKQVDYQKPITLVNMDYEIETIEGLLPNKVKYPLQLVFIFSLFFIIRFLFRKMKNIAESN